MDSSTFVSWPQLQTPRRYYHHSPQPPWSDWRRHSQGCVGHHHHQLRQGYLLALHKLVARLPQHPEDQHHRRRWFQQHFSEGCRSFFTESSRLPPANVHAADVRAIIPLLPLLLPLTSSLWFIMPTCFPLIRPCFPSEQRLPFLVRSCSRMCHYCCWSHAWACHRYRRQSKCLNGCQPF